MKYLTIADLRKKGCKFLPVNQPAFALGGAGYNVEAARFRTADEVYEFLRDKNAAILCDENIAVKMMPNGYLILRWTHISPRYIEGPILWQTIVSDQNGDLERVIYLGAKRIIRVLLNRDDDLMLNRFPEAEEKLEEFERWMVGIPDDEFTTIVPEPEPEVEEPEEVVTKAPFSEEPPRDLEL